MRYCRTIKVIDAVLAYGSRWNMEWRWSKTSAVDGKGKSIDFSGDSSHALLGLRSPFLDLFQALLGTIRKL